MVNFKQLLDNLTVSTHYLEELNIQEPDKAISDVIRSNYQLLREAGYLLPSQVISIVNKSGA